MLQQLHYCATHSNTTSNETMISETDQLFLMPVEHSTSWADSYKI